MNGLRLTIGAFDLPGAGGWPMMHELDGLPPDF